MQFNPFMIYNPFKTHVLYIGLLFVSDILK